MCNIHIFVSFYCTKPKKAGQELGGGNANLRLSKLTQLQICQGCTWSSVHCIDTALKGGKAGLDAL